MLLVKRLLGAVSAEAINVATHEQPRFVNGVAKRIAGVAENNQIARLAHKSGEVTDRAFDDDIDALHGDAASRRGVAVNYQKAAVPVAPAPCEASPFTWTRPEIMFSATP